jgi:glutamyl/glutaminyl-tRNA synthetase
VHALAAVLADAAPLVDRDAFRAAAGQVKERTGFKGKALFHPIRVVLTGAAEGPELDILVPAIDRAAALPPDAGLPTVLACRARAQQVAALLPA